jgi:hypothetical protein
MAYRIDDEHGSEISNGHSLRNAARDVAQHWANKHEAYCYVSEDTEEACSYEVSPQSNYEVLKAALGCADVGGGNAVEDCDALYDRR